jgi:hypothetical protein
MFDHLSQPQKRFGSSRQRMFTGTPFIAETRGVIAVPLAEAQEMSAVEKAKTHSFFAALCDFGQW